MSIKKIKIENYRTLRNVSLDFHEHLNIIVGNNECGKSTILEALNLALTGQLNGRSIYNELHPFMFNTEVVNQFIKDRIAGKSTPPPNILIEVYFSTLPELEKLRGTINSSKEDCPGVSFSIEFDETFNNEFKELIKTPEDLRVLPVEYYSVKWRSFANDNVVARSISVKPMLVDVSSVRHNSGASKYLLDILQSYLKPEEKAKLSLSYRKMKDSFLVDKGVMQINEELEKNKSRITNRKLSISLDSTSKSSWENGIEAQVDDIPLFLAGKGEQNCIKIKLAMESASKSNLFLIEEPENHLSFSNLNKLLNDISTMSKDKQLIVTTHSSFVLNKLGIKSVILFSQDKKGITLADLKNETKDYFLKLPGHDTLRLILSKRTILVEGPSDELIVQKAFLMKYGKMPLEKDVDVISVKSLAFKRFLEISSKLNIPTCVLTDNDGDTSKLDKKYEDFKKDSAFIKILFDEDVSFKTLEPQLLKINGRDRLNKIFKTSYSTDEELLNFMIGNKTDCALSILNTSEEFVVPDYIMKAVNE